jgi:hypothetical protein
VQPKLAVEIKQGPRCPHYHYWQHQERLLRQQIVLNPCSTIFGFALTPIQSFHILLFPKKRWLDPIGMWDLTPIRAKKSGKRAGVEGAMAAQGVLDGDRA